MPIRRFLSELRYPTTSRGKIIAATLAAVASAFLSLVVVGGFFLVRALMPLQAGEIIDPTTFLGNAQSLAFQTPDGKAHSGWFFPGLRAAPLVVICHGYNSSRSEILTLATSLQQHRYNVFAFNFAGHGESPVGYTTLGYKETEELLAALALLATRTDIDTERIGLWGYSLGAYAVLSAAPRSPQVKALVVDSAYPVPESLLRLELENLGANMIPLLTSISTLEFRLLAVYYGGQLHPTEARSSLAGLPKLFVVGSDAPALAAMTRELYQEVPEPKELAELPRTNMASLTEQERRNYENLVVGFFLRHLPLRASRR